MTHFFSHELYGFIHSLFLYNIITDLYIYDFVQDTFTLDIKNTEPEYLFSHN